MGVFSAVRDWFRPRGRAVADEETGPPIANVVPLWQAGKPAPPDGDPVKHSERYATSSVICAVIRELATSAAEPTWLVERGTERMDDEDLVGSVLAFPSESLSSVEWRQRLITDLEGIHGEVILHKLRSARGIWRKTEPLRVDRIEVIPRKDGTIEKYRYGKQDVNPRDIIHWKQYHPLNDYRGLSPLEVLWTEGMLDADTMLYLSEFFRNGGIPSFALTVQGQVTRKQREESAAEIRELYGRFGTGGSRRSGYGEWAIFSNGATVQSLGIDPTKLDLSAVFSVSESRACAMFGVPAVVAGFLVAMGSQPYGSWREARRSFVIETCCPLWQKLDAAMTMELRREFGPGYRARFDTRKLIGLQAVDTEARSDAQQAFDRDLFTRDETRERLGQEPMDNGQSIMKSDLARGAVPASSTSPALRP